MESLLLPGHVRIAGAIAAAFLFAACSKDPAAEGALRGGYLRFEVTEANSSRTRSQSRTAEDSLQTKESAAVFTLQGETPADTLFLHASVADGIAAPQPNAQTDRPQTRATPIETANFYDSFGVLASVYTGSWSETACLPDYMYNVEVTKASSWTTSYHWPGSGRNIRFFAYAPYNGTGISLSSATKAGTPTIAYTVPKAVGAQRDLLVAATSGIAGNTAAAAPLTFAHALTAIRFTTGDDMLAGRITKITLKGVYGSGSYTMGADSWGDYGATADFSQTLRADVDGSADQEITPVAATFMMLPQTLPSGASIEVVYTDNLTSTQRTLTASIAGSLWPIGKTVTYRISTSSISMTPTFSVTPPSAFTYAGGSQNYSVTSCAAVSRSSDASQTVPVAWTAEFVEDDGAGGYNVISRPDWLTAFTASGAGSISDSSFSAAVAAQTAVTSNSHNETLWKAEPVSGTYDLSTKGGTTAMNTANCYIINAPGKYSLPLVYGNAVKNGSTNASAYTSQASGTYVLKTFVNHLDAPITDPYIYNNADCTPNNAVLVWQDEENLVTNVALAPDGHSLTFDVGSATIKQGNAIVAVRDASNRIMWSWHIWVTDFVPGLPPTVTPHYNPAEMQRDKVVTSNRGLKYTFMGVNIGWCDGGITTYDARSVKVRFKQTKTGATQIITISQDAGETKECGNCSYFQFGRKDPMLGGILTTSWPPDPKSCYSDSGYAFDKSGTGKVSIGTAIQNPHVFYDRDPNRPWDWCSTSYYNCWSADNIETTAYDKEVVKTVYDPSPVGYHLPPPDAFTGFTYSGQTTRKSSEGDSYFGSQFNSPYTSSDDVGLNYGWTVYCNRMPGIGNYDTSGGVIFIPGTSMLHASYSGLGRFGFYWAAVGHSIDAGLSTTYSPNGFVLLYPSVRYYGFTVRPVRE